MLLPRKKYDCVNLITNTLYYNWGLRPASYKRRLVMYYSSDVLTEEIAYQFVKR